MGSSKLIEKLYFGFFLLLPLVFYTKIVDSVLLPRQILLTLFVLVIVLVLMQKKTVLLFNFNSKFFITALLFLGLNLISFYQSNVISESHAVFSKLLLLFSFFAITTFLLYNKLISKSKIITAVVIFGIITLSFPLFEIVKKTMEGQHLLRQIDIVKGNSANKNLLSSILFLCLPFYFMGLKERKVIRYLSIFSIFSTLFILITIRTRIVLIACLLFFVLLICYKLKQQFSIKKRYFLITFLVFIFLSLTTYKLYFESKINHLHSSSENITQQYFYRLLDSQTLKSRIRFWQNSIEMAKDHPVLGVGLGNWQVIFPKYGLNNLNSADIINGESTLQRPHNDYIWILCETGILGLIAYLTLFGVIFYQLLFLIKKTSEPREKWMFFYILSTLTSYLLISFFDFPYERVEHQVIIMLFFALVTASYHQAIESSGTKSNRWVLFLLLIPIGYSFLVSLYRFNGEQHAIKTYAAKQNKNWSEMIFEAKKAENYFYKLDNTSMPLQWYEGIGYFNEKQPEESEACFYKAYQLNPFNIEVINNLASACQVNGKQDKAIALYKEALTISHDFDEAKLNLAALYFNRKDYDKAFSTINEVSVDSKNSKYKVYLVPILNQKINAFLKTSNNKEVVNKLVKNINTTEKLLQLFFDAKKANITFENYLIQVTF